MALISETKHTERGTSHYKYCHGPFNTNQNVITKQLEI